MSTWNTVSTFDLAGKTFGDIMIISKSPRQRRKSSPSYDCKCKCGAKFALSRHEVMKLKEDEKCFHKIELISEGNHIGHIGGKEICLRIQGQALCGANLHIDGAEVVKIDESTLLVKLNSLNGKLDLSMKENKKKVKVMQYPEGTTHVRGSSIHAIRANIMKNTKTGVRGVMKISRTGDFKAYLVFKGRQISLGYFKDLESAALARHTAEKLVYGEYLEWYDKMYAREFLGMIGTIKGDLSVESYASKENQQDGLAYNCKCLVCGKETIQLAYDLYHNTNVTHVHHDVDTLEPN